MPRFPSPVYRALTLGALLLATGCGGRGNAQDPVPEKPPVPARALVTTPLAGQKISVLPLTMIITDEALSTDPTLVSRSASLHWADSLLGEALTRRVPDVSWVLPPELRRIAHRAPSMEIDPDRMGQSVMAAPKVNALPDPLRTYTRSLVALAGGRLILIPAVYNFSRTPEGTVKVEVSVVMADVRSGQVVFRSLIPATGESPAAALNAAYRVMLPLPTDQ
jgi:hypothetical protein